MAAMDTSGPRPSQIAPARPPLPVGPTATAIVKQTQAPLFGVFLGRVGYALAWFCIHFFRVLCAAYFVAAGYLYAQLPKSHTGRMLQLYSLTIGTTYFRAIGIGHFVVAALHLRFVVTSFLYTAVMKLISHRRQKQLRGLHNRLSLRHKQLTVRVFAPKTLRRSLLSTITYPYGVLFAPSGFFGVESHSFEIIFLCRELLETSMQTYQAYTMSCLLPRVSLNRFYVAMLVLNCWTTPALHRLTSDKALQRLVCLLSDILLDFISAVGVPVVLSIDYLDSYDFQAAIFPLALLYSDQWLMRFMSEAPLILCGSWVDALSRSVFSLAMLVIIDDVTVLIKRKTSQVDSSARTSSSLAPATATATHNTPTQKPTRAVQWIHRVMVLLGFVILSVQLHAESKPAPRACVDKVRPWFVQRPACALVEINCLKTSSPSNLATVLDGLDALSVGSIVIRHCKQVDMPTQLQSLSNLIGIKAYNTTIIKWDADSALTQHRHPHARFAFFVRTNFANSQLPEGLLSASFPRKLWDLEFSITNLNSLPDDLDTRWPRGLVLLIEYSQLTEFPQTILRLSPRTLSLCGNQITTIPREAFLMPTTRTLSLTANPLTSLPDDDDNIDPRAVFTTFFLFDMTNLTTLPRWMDETFFQEKVVTLSGTTICLDVILNDSATLEREAVQATRPSMLTTVDCVVMPTNDQPFYPHHLEVRADEDL